jgi:glucose-1-phosphate thymidylyltransferase
MKAVILAGGRATRLYPLTKVTNKHLLPVYDKPVIYHSIEKLVKAGIERIMIVTSPGHADDFVSLLGSGENFTSPKTGKQIQIVYGIQNEPSGIAYGLYIAKDYVGDDNCVLYLGDNIIEDDISSHITNFKSGAKVFLTKVKEPHRFGIATIKGSKIVEIVEKPTRPTSKLAVVGLYIYDNTVFDKMIGQPVSKRGEKEITYINNKYIKEGTLTYAVLRKKWFDTGTFQGLFDASLYMERKHRRKGDEI